MTDWNSGSRDEKARQKASIMLDFRKADVCLFKDLFGSLIGLSPGAKVGPRKLI